MTSLHITTQSLEHILSTSTDWLQLLFSFLGSLFAALVAVAYSELSLKKRDAQFKREEAEREKKQIEATLNWHTEILYSNLSNLLRLLVNDIAKYPSKPVELNQPPTPETMLTLATVAHDAFIHTQASIEIIKELNEKLQYERATLTNKIVHKYGSEGCAHIFCAWAWLQQCEDYNLNIKNKPYLYFTDKAFGFFKEFAEITKKSIEVNNREVTLDKDLIVKNYNTKRDNIFHNALIHNKKQP